MYFMPNIILVHYSNIIDTYLFITIQKTHFVFITYLSILCQNEFFIDSNLTLYYSIKSLHLSGLL